MKKLVTFAAAVMGAASVACATQRLVPQQYATIQLAIQASSHTDTVLVSPGRYYENIVFRGKRITVASLYLTTGNRSYIRSTIIDGSQPLHADTASVVRIINAEDSTTVLAGFTITGGKGTKWPDAHNGFVYREGGGILCEGSSPVIRDNFIYRNEAINSSGVASAGGGAIRADGGNPRILHNVILRNKGRYGAGIVLNYSGGIVRNNIINLNSGGQDFGGSGIWVLENGPAPKLIENNTIAGNISSTNGGGVLVWTATVTLRNNIIYGNTGGANPQIFTQQGGLAVASFNLVEGGHPGPGSIAGYPMFSDSAATLLAASPAIDAGDPAAFFYDPANTAMPAQAAAPALGSIANDMGAYGGQGSSWFTQFSQASLVLASGYALPGVAPAAQAQIKLPFSNRGLANLKIDSMSFVHHGSQFQAQNIFPLTVRSVATDTLRFMWSPASPGAFVDTLLVYHSDTSLVNPRVVRLTGSVLSGVSEAVSGGHSLGQNVPNPFSEATQISYRLARPAFVSVSVIDGLGRLVHRQEKGWQQAGQHMVQLSGQSLPAGLYYYRLQLADAPDAGAAVQLTQKMMVSH